MTLRKYNEFLDDGASGDEGTGSSHHSDDAQERKGRGTSRSANSSKRLKLSQESREESSAKDDSSGSEEAGMNTLVHPFKKTSPSRTIDDELSTGNSPSPPKPTTAAHPQLTGKPKASTRPSKPGVVYLSRIPPFMRPSTVRHLLTSFGLITKIFLTPEPPAKHTSRVRSGGNKKRSFIDGWIEFASHKSAKTCVAAINGQTMGGRGWYRDDVWNAKYLKGFGWEDLMSSVRAEEREREERVRVGVRRERKEREEFLKGVERGKMEETRKRKREKGVDEGEPGKMRKGKQEGFERRFRQNEIKSTKRVEAQPEEVTRVLSRIF
ncbi:MAG: hypothetical protein Q9182_000793 [Xanthomendoza sp. 2 TL-2023]